MSNVKEFDTRTFIEIWRSLSPAEQSELRYQLMHDISCTRQTIHNWVNGASPNYRVVRMEVAKTINKMFGLNTKHLTLFPEAH